MSSVPENKPVLCLMGTTATGKTDIAIELLQEFPVEIISVDSAMVYRGLDIGTAKPDKTTLEAAPHHLIDIIEPTEAYSAANFRRDALDLIKTVHQRNKIPLLVGGTLLYFRALLSGLSQLPAADPAIRAEIEAEAAEHGWAALHEELSRIDPVSASKIHPNDPQRLQRAIEVFRISSLPLSELQRRGSQADFPYPVLKFALIAEDREWLHKRIETRFSMMLKQGLIDEVEGLYAREDMHLDLPSMRSVGYRQVWQYLQGKWKLQEMKERAIIATRQLAKRQHTWLRSESDLVVFDPHQMKQNDIISELKSAIKMFDVL